MTTKISPYRSGELRFGSGSKETGPVNSEVKTYQLTPEELEQVRGGKPVFTKEQYLAYKDEGLSDQEIVNKVEGLHMNKLNAHKRQWGLIGKFGPAAKKATSKEPEKKQEVIVENAREVAAPDEKETVKPPKWTQDAEATEWRDRYYEAAQYASKLEADLDILKQTIRILSA